MRKSAAPRIILVTVAIALAVGAYTFLGRDRGG